MVYNLAGAVIAVTFTIYAFHSRDWFLLMLSALVNFFVWAPWFRYVPGLALVMWFVSALQAIYSMLDVLSGGRTLGWSQIKVMLRRRE